MKALGSYRRRNKKLRASGHLSYQEYLKSEHWRTLRLKVLERDCGQCVACGRTATCVHHTKYSKRVLFGENPTPALVSLCNGCHQFIEFEEDGAKSNLKRVGEKLRWACKKNGRCLPGRCVVCQKGGRPKGTDTCRHCRSRQKKDTS